ncbi:MAG: IPT/TIG domain-containing protein [Myxococcota bacterium]|nr:IPT/TIG domain-containing protein [Myxococcota bacterium]
MSVALLTAVLLLGATEPPEITELYPSPLPLGGTVDITGVNFEPDDTTVALISDLDPLATPINQSIVYVLETNVRFDVSMATPVGGATLRVTTSVGDAEVAVEVVPPPPILESVEPDPVLLGDLATLHGSGLDSVETVTLGGEPCDVTAQGAGLIVCMTQATAALIGLEVPMTVTGPYGTDTLLVDTAPPEPVIDSLGPNPIRQGDLLTIQGALLSHMLSVHVGGHEATLVESTDGQLIVGVPLSVPSGATEVTVSIGSTTSNPAGPLWIDAADSDRPAVTALYPSAIVAGGAAWAIGTDLDGVDWSSGGITYDSCDDKACRLTFPDLGPGPQAGAIGGPKGTSVLAVQILEDTGQSHPTLTGAQPNPAFVGESLTLNGEGLHEVSHVLIGGVVQPIDYLGADEVRVTVSDLTPRGAERAFVAGHSASDALTITVLDPFPTGPGDGPDGGSETDAHSASDGGHTPEPEVGPGPSSDTDNSDGQTDDDTTETDEDTGVGGGTGGGGGCGGSPTPAVPTGLALVALIAVMTRRRLLV